MTAHMWVKVWLPSTLACMGNRARSCYYILPQVQTGPECYNACSYMKLNYQLNNSCSLTKETGIGTSPHHSGPKAA